MRRRRHTSGILVILAMAGLYGCGSGSNYRTIPILTGSYTGRFVQVAGLTTETGTMSIVIGPDHRLAGTVSNETTTMNGTIVGDIESGLLLNAVLTYADMEYRLTGKVGKDERQNLVGALTVRNAGGSSVGTLSVDLALSGAGE